MSWRLFLPGFPGSTSLETVSNIFHHHCHYFFHSTLSLSLNWTNETRAGALLEGAGFELAASLHSERDS